MGFGVLFLGFLFLLTSPFHEIVLTTTGVDILPTFVGYVIMLYACRRLSPYERRFKLSCYALNALIVLNLFNFAFGIADAHSESEVVTSIKNVFTYLEAIVLAAFLVVLFRALSAISGQVGKTALSARAKLASFVCAGYYALVIILKAAAPKLASSNYMVFANYVLWFIIFAFCIIQVYGCYMWICFEGDEDLTEKPNKIVKFLNDLRRSEEEIDKNTLERRKAYDLEKKAQTKKKKGK